jgi:hypothetical protein
MLRRSMLHNAASDPSRMMVCTAGMMVCTAGCGDLGTEQVGFTGEEISGV